MPKEMRLIKYEHSTILSIMKSIKMTQHFGGKNVFGAPRGLAEPFNTQWSRDGNDAEQQRHINTRHALLGIVRCWLCALLCVAMTIH